MWLPKSPHAEKTKVRNNNAISTFDKNIFSS